MSSDWEFGLELNDSTSVSEPAPTRPGNVFTERGRNFLAEYQKTGITETLDFLGLAPA